MLEIVRLQADIAEALKNFFAAIDRPDIRDAFSPHEFTAAKADELCRYAGKDEYYVLVQGTEVLGYGMLRGWDEGYAVPSLGICIHPRHAGQRLGLTLMYHLIAAARLRGSERIILKVKKNNEAAIRLYRRVGFALATQDEQFLKGTLDLKK